MMSGKQWIKLITGMVFLHLVLPLAAAGKVEVLVEPQPVRTGEAAFLIIRSTDGTRNQPLNNRLPEVSGLSWMGGTMQSSQTHIINGRRSSVFELKIPFMVSRPGTYTIPSFDLTHSRERTKKVVFEAVAARYQTSPQSRRRPASSGASQEEGGLTPDQIMFMETTVPGRRPFYYLGEEIPLDINLYVLEGVQPRLSWPKISFGEKSSAVFRDYRQSNPENPNFAGMTQHQVERAGRRYIRCSFRTVLRPITAGNLEINVRENAAIIVRDNSRRRSAGSIFDEFFGDDPFFSRGRQVDRNMNNALTLEIRELPAVPDGTRFIGLIGRWDSQVTLSPPPYRVGEPITMKVEFQGTGSADTLRPWPLDLKGFRVYPPEVERNIGGAEIRYVLIPTEPADGKTENVSFGPYAVFDKGTYQTKSFKRAIAVEKGSAVIPGNAGAYTVDNTPSEPAKARTDEPKRKAEDILYLKKNEGRTVPLPPEVNVIGGIIVILAGIVYLIIALILRGIRKTRENDPDYQRKAAAHSRKPALLARLKQLPPEEIPAACGADIASYLADATGLPPGADLAECAAAVKKQSPELASMLEEISQASWMPSMKSKFTPEFRDALLKALRKAAAVLLVCLSGSLIAAEKVTHADQAMNAYDTGKFGEAEKYYRSRLNPAEPSANLLYNIGNCLYQQGYFPQAMVCFERASRLSPRDPDILENLNLTRRKLMLPEKYKVESPSDILPYLRDSLRPDEWLFLVCCGMSLLLFAAGTALLTGSGRTFRILLTGGILLIAAPGIAYLMQQRTSYNPDFAVVTAKTLQVRSLPSDQAGKTEMNLRSGEEVTVVERRMDWVRIRSGSAEGWVHAKDITSLWSPNSAGDI